MSVSLPPNNMPPFYFKWNAAKSSKYVLVSVNSVCFLTLTWEKPTGRGPSMWSCAEGQPISNVGRRANGWDPSLSRPQETIRIYEKRRERHVCTHSHTLTNSHTRGKTPNLEIGSCLKRSVPFCCLDPWFLHSQIYRWVNFKTKIQASAWHPVVHLWILSKGINRTISVKRQVSFHLKT